MIRIQVPRRTCDPKCVCPGNSFNRVKQRG